MKVLKAKGKVFKYGDNIDTDVIIPARYLSTADPNELKKYCMEDIDKDFVNKVKQGDIMVGGENFGCGSSREHAPIAIKASGILREEIFVTTKLWIQRENGYENTKKALENLKETNRVLFDELIKKDYYKKYLD